jgi:2,4-dienoyl-CoA reductase-like NADH-dependent reductase (Old Yellow Enzyme family)
MPSLFDSLPLRSLTLANRIVVSPMCQYSSIDGFANDWHEIHLASRAVGGAAVVFTEATAVTPEGRISPHDLGIWDDRHIPALARITKLIRSRGSIPAMQLAHAGRKASTTRPWEGIRGIADADGGWNPVGPTDQPFSPTYCRPRALDADAIGEVVRSFARAAERALDAGFDIVEVHAAHGYLVHEFLSPVVNTRTDAYGGSFDNRICLCLDVVDAIRRVWPERLPLFVRISATDWVDGGWDIEQSVALARRLREHGVDLIDCSSGGLVPHATVPLAPGYQVPFAARVRRDAAIPTGAVGLITDPHQAQAIVAGRQADCVLLARELLRDPYWPMRAARELAQPIAWPAQYLRAAPAGAPERT